MSGFTRDGTAKPVSRDHIIRREPGQEKAIFPVQLTASRIGNPTRLVPNPLNVMTNTVTLPLLTDLKFL